MQVVTVTKAALCSEAFTYPMLEELAVRYLAMSKEAVEKLAAQRLTKGSRDMQALPFAKLRTVILNKLDTAAHANPEQFGNWTEGTLQLEFDCLPDLDIGKAGANKRKRGAAKADGDTAKAAPKHSGGVPRTGEYEVVKRPASPSVNGGDAGKWEIWEHVWACRSFEDYFAKAPAKGVASATNRPITASMEMNWALKSGWIRPVVKAEAEAEAETKQPAA